MSESATHRAGLCLLMALGLVACSNGLELDQVVFKGDPAVEDAIDEPEEPEPEVVEGCAGGCDIGEVCLERVCTDLCEGVSCPAPDPTCEDEAAIRHTGDGRCDPRSGECDFAAVRIATDCLAIGRVCQQDQCVVTCDGEGCAQPEDFCDGDVAVTYEGNGVCQENNDCDFTQVETRVDCDAQNEICDEAACVFDPGARLMISEILYNPPGNDRDREWVEIYNGTRTLIDLSTMSLGAGGDSYDVKRFQLRGALGPGECFVLGGPDQDEGNALPVYDQPVSLNAGLQNHTMGGADGVALFDVPANEIGPETVPIDAVIYGEDNDNKLIDEFGEVGDPDIGGAADGQSLERVGPDEWRIQIAPTPNDCDVLR